MDDRQDYAAIDERGVYAVTLKDPPFAVTAKARASWDRDVAKLVLRHSGLIGAHSSPASKSASRVDSGIP